MLLLRILASPILMPSLRSMACLLFGLWRAFSSPIFALVSLPSPSNAQQGAGAQSAQNSLGIPSKSTFKRSKSCKRLRIFLR